MTTEQTTAMQSRRINTQPHRLGMGWHHIWEYDPPIEHHVQHEDGTSRTWQEDGETSEGCIMWFADCFAREQLRTTAREVYCQAYKADDDHEFEDDWLDTDVLRGMWAPHTRMPRRWDRASVHELFEDLEDVNYHSFLLRLIELVEDRLPDLAASLSGWCKPTSQPAQATRPTPTPQLT